MTTLDTLARLRSRSEVAGEYVLPLDRVWADKAIVAYDALNRAEMVLADENDPESSKRIATAQAEVDRIVEEAGENVVIFRFRRLGRAHYDKLVSQNPVTDAQKEEDAAKPFGERRAFNMDTFGPQLLQAGMIEPKLDPWEIELLLNGTDEEVLLSKGEAEYVLNAAITAALSRPRTLPAKLILP